MIGVGDGLKKLYFRVGGQMTLKEERIKRNLVFIVSALHLNSYVDPLIAISSNLLI
jgi:hypothetical protein